MEKVQEIKKTFYAYRNGIIADRLRNAGDCHAVIFGLNIPQIVNIANELGQDTHLARQLWSNSNSRESRMLAPMLFPCDELGYDEACLWIEDVENVEIADNLCHKLLRKVDSAEKLFQKYANADKDLLRYVAFRLAMNLLCIDAVADRVAMLDAAKDKVSEEDYNRAKYVIEEKDRVLAVCDALKRGDYDTVGECMYATHRGMSELYEVSCEELDFLNDIARKCGVTGSRIMGGGFGGCTINLVKNELHDEFIATAKKEFAAKYGHEPMVYDVIISDGAHKC